MITLNFKKCAVVATEYCLEKITDYIQIISIRLTGDQFITIFKSKNMIFVT